MTIVALIHVFYHPDEAHSIPGIPSSNLQYVAEKNKSRKKLPKISPFRAQPGRYISSAADHVVS